MNKYNIKVGFELTKEKFIIKMELKIIENRKETLPNLLYKVLERTL